MPAPTPPPCWEEQRPRSPPQLCPQPCSGQGTDAHPYVADNVARHSSKCVTNIPLDRNYFLIKTKETGMPVPTLCICYGLK